MPSEELNPVAEVADTMVQIGQSLADLDADALAELRRGPGRGSRPQPAYFWRLAARHAIIRSDEDAWLRIIRIMAILTDTGNVVGKLSPHAGKSAANHWRGFGTALCDGGDRQWGVTYFDRHPMLSELRLARLLVATGDMRADLMERAARALAAKKPPGSGGVDCADLADFLLRLDDPEPGRRLARSYYARLERGMATDHPTDTSATGDDE
jgi:CRISPR system Cascade subunit CasB